METCQRCERISNITIQIDSVNICLLCFECCQQCGAIYQENINDKMYHANILFYEDIKENKMWKKISKNIKRDLQYSNDN